jgi:DNA repair exonuclease SbcCD ATPase subunit
MKSKTRESELNKLRESIADESKVSQKIRQLQELRVKITHKIDTIKKEVGFFHDYDNCPTCQQEIDPEFKSETILAKTTKITETEDGLSKLNEEHDKTASRLEEIVQVNTKLPTSTLSCQLSTHVLPAGMSMLSNLMMS